MSDENKEKQVCPNVLCGKEHDGPANYCSDECYLESSSLNPTVATLEDVERMVRMVQLNEAEAVKLNLKSNDVLFVTVKHDDVSSEQINQLRRQLNTVFPNNKIFVFNIGLDGDIKFAVATEEKVNYCSDCNCGKKPA